MDHGDDGMSQVDRAISIKERERESDTLHL